MSDIQDITNFRIFITGATGFLGSWIVAELLNKGFAPKNITALARSGEKARFLEKEKIQILESSLEELKTETFEGEAPFDLIIHCASHVSDWPLDFDYFHKINVKPTEELLNLALKHKAKFMYISTAAVFGHSLRNRVIINEDAEYNEKEASRYPYSKSKLEASKLVERYSDKIECSVIYPGCVYGPPAKKGWPEEKIYAPEFIAGIKSRVAPYITGNNIMPLSFAGNVGEPISRLSLKRDWGRRYNRLILTDNEIVTFKDFCLEIAKRLKIKPVFGKPFFELPKFLNYAITKVGSGLYFLLKVKTRPILTDFTYDYVQVDAIFSNQRAVELLNLKLVAFKECMDRTFKYEPE